MDTNSKNRVTLGCLETVDLPSLNLTGVVAKIDTGALTGALHCEDIRVTRRVSGERILRFRPLDSTQPLYKTTDFSARQVISASGHRTKRYIIPVTLRIQGVLYDSFIGLTNRKTMGRPMLIGRSFIRRTNMLVDVHINEDKDDEKEMVL